MFVRKDQVNYYPSRDPFADTPATVGEARQLMNYGTKTDISYAAGRHNLKVGTQIMQTRLHERFQLGITDPEFNPVCLNSGGDAFFARSHGSEPVRGSWVYRES